MTTKQCFTSFKKTFANSLPITCPIIHYFALSVELSTAVHTESAKYFDLNNICSESMSVARLSSYTTYSGRMESDKLTLLGSAFWHLNCQWKGSPERDVERDRVSSFPLSFME